MQVIELGVCVNKSLDMLSSGVGHESSVIGCDSNGSRRNDDECNNDVKNEVMQECIDSCIPEDLLLVSQQSSNDLVQVDTMEISANQQDKEVDKNDTKFDKNNTKFDKILNKKKVNRATRRKVKKSVKKVLRIAHKSAIIDKLLNRKIVNDKVVSMSSKVINDKVVNSKAVNDKVVSSKAVSTKPMGNKKTTKENKIMNMLNIKGFILIPVKEDKLCLYRSLSYIICSTVEKYQIFHSLSIDFINNNWKYFKSFTNLTKYQYISNKQKFNTYSDDIELIAFSIIFDTYIYIYSKQLKYLYKIDSYPIHRNHIHLIRDGNYFKPLIDQHRPFDYSLIRADAFVNTRGFTDSISEENYVNYCYITMQLSDTELSEIENLLLDYVIEQSIDI